MKLLLRNLWLTIVLLLSVNNVNAFDEGKTSANVARTKAEAAQKARQQVKGRVLKVEQRGDVFRVKLLQASGRVISIEIKKAPSSRD